MSRHHQKLFAIKYSCLAALLLCTAQVFAADSIGVVSQVEGTLQVRNSVGVMRAAAANTPIDVGDTLLSQTGSFAKIRFIDDSELTLKPDTQLKVEAFIYDEKSDSKQGALFSLSTGGVLVLTGRTAVNTSEGFKLLAPSLQDPIGTITANRKDYGIFYVEHKADSTKDGVAWYPSNRRPIMLAMNETTTRTDAPLMLAGGANQTQSGLAAGLYVSVIDGAINLSNKGGSTSFSAGQFGYTANAIKPPVLVPANPGIKFTAPATFSSSTSSNKSGAKAVDCDVR
ncbi:MAG: hypothetical protein ACKVN9_08020 [Methylophilaceae bacterium]